MTIFCDWTKGMALPEKGVKKIHRRRCPMNGKYAMELKRSHINPSSAKERYPSAVTIK